MQISWKCLNQLIDLTHISPLDIAHRLTLAGLEIENLIYKDNAHDDDTILDISITANRQDIIGIIDIAIELSSLLKRPLKLENYTKPDTITEVLNNADHLNLFQEIYICIIKNIPSQFINKNFNNQLANPNFKMTYNIIDIVHFINFKWSQEIYIYKLPRNENTNKCWFTFNLNKLKNNLDIYINNKILTPISNYNINQHKDISNILLINYKYKHKNSLSKNNLFTSEQYCIYAYKDIFNILNKLSNNIFIPKTIYKYSDKNTKNNTIQCNIATINKILGPTINNQKNLFNQNRIINILRTLNFHTFEKNNILHIQIPNKRSQDIEHAIDIVEEIGRIYGFNNFQDDLPKFKDIHQRSKIMTLTQKIRRILRSMGLHELINYSLQNKKDRTCISITNPLNKELATLRKNLISNLIISKRYNTNQTNYRFEAFEIGKVFIKNLSENKYQESLQLCCILGNQQFNQVTWEENKDGLSWFQAKGHLEEFFEKINAQISWSLHTDNNELIQNLKEYTHPKKKIYIQNQNRTIGILSELNNEINKIANLTHRIYFFEINIYELAKTIKHQTHLQHTYIPYSQYPKITRDFSIKINTKFSMQDINDSIENIKKRQKEIIESIKIINEYYNNENTKTICFRIIYRSQQRTLTNKEIQILDNMLKRKLNEDLQSKT